MSQVTCLSSGNLKTSAALVAVQEMENERNNRKKYKSIVVSGSRDKSVRVWDIDAGAVLLVMYGHGGCIHGVTLAMTQQENLKLQLRVKSPTVLSCGDDGSVFVWSVESGKVLKDLKWHSNSVKGITAAMIPSSGAVKAEMVIASCGWDKNAIIHDLDLTLNTDEENGGCCSIS